MTNKLDSTSPGPQLLMGDMLNDDDTAEPAAPAQPVSSAALVQTVAALAPALMRLAAQGDPSGAFPAESLALLQRAGLATAPLPLAFGGLGLNDAAERLTLLRVLKHIGRGDLVVGRLYEGHVNALQLIFQFGNPRQQRAAAAAAHEGLWSGVWNTQAHDGLRLVAQPPSESGSDMDSDPDAKADVERGAARPHAPWRLAGSKTFASGAGHLQRPLVTAALPDGGWQLVVLRADRHPPLIDRSFWQPLGMRGSGSHRASFDGIAVAADCLIGAPGDYLREPGFNAGAVRFAAVQLGGAEALLDETRRFLRGLGRTDDPHQRTRIGEMALAVETGNLWLAGAARHVDEVPYAQLMRTAIEQLAMQVMQQCQRCIGSRGLMQPEPFERLIRDLSHYLRQAGPDAALAQAGAHLLAQQAPAHQLWNESPEPAQPAHPMHPLQDEAVASRHGP